MLKLHRSREKDPIHKLDKDNKKFGARTMPNMDQDYVEMKVFKPLPPEDIEPHKKQGVLCARGFSGTGCL